jgi:hypothetical protein
MTDDTLELLEKQIGDLFCNALRRGGRDQNDFTVGDLLATASALGTDDYDDASDAIADMLYKTMFGMPLREAYEASETDDWSSRPIYMSARLDSPSDHLQQGAVNVDLFIAHEFFEVSVSVELQFECDFPYGVSVFYSKALRSYSLDNIGCLLCASTEVRVRATQKAKDQPPMVPFSDIGIEGISQLAPADMAVANGYEWLQGQVFMAFLQMNP